MLKEYKTVSEIAGPLMMVEGNAFAPTGRYSLVKLPFRSLPAAIRV